MPHVAVVLAGCGHRDGAEIREAVFTLLALDGAEASVQCFAPDKEQADVIDHVTGQVQKEKRNVLVEAARIARGDILPLDEFDATEFDALIFPGGFGGAKNLSDFASAGAKATVDPDVRAAVEAMHAAEKPIGFICITPAAVAAPLLGGEGVKLTAGDEADPAAAAIEKLGAEHVVCAANQAVMDVRNKVVSTPAYMHADARPSDVYKGITELVQGVLQMTQAVTVTV